MISLSGLCIDDNFDVFLYNYVEDSEHFIIPGVLNTEGDIICFLNKIVHMNISAKEISVIAGVNYDKDEIKTMILSIGDDSSCQVFEKSILQFICLFNPDKVFFVHNHPNNVLKYSQEDINTNNNIRCLCEKMNVCFEDSLIISRNKTYSFSNDKEIDF